MIKAVIDARLSSLWEVNCLVIIIMTDNFVCVICQSGFAMRTEEQKMCGECQILYAIKLSSSQSEAREVSLAMHELRLGSDEQSSPREHAQNQLSHSLTDTVKSLLREVQNKEQEVANLNNLLNKYSLQAANLGIIQAIYDETQPDSDIGKFNKAQYMGTMRTATATLNQISDLIENI